MKYEAVFGDQSLFDGCYDETASIVIATSNGLKFVDGEFTEYGIVEGDVKSDGLRIAMRRIIRTPTWTVADQKAGKLPGVGCKVFDVMNENEVIVKAINTRQVCLESSDGFIYLLPPSEIKPIETPKEKAQREEDEFIDSLKSVEIHDGTVKSFFAQGARAAYRKLKGGE